VTNLITPRALFSPILRTK